MKFVVSRTSLPNANASPCKGAFKGKYTRVDTRSVDDPKKVPLSEGSDGKWWYEEGTNHRVEDGQITRDIEEEGWILKIDTLQELINFIDVHGSVILDRSRSNPGTAEMEIYDDYI